MEENNEKREFTQLLERTAETLSNAVKDNEGRAFILIGSDKNDDVQVIMAVRGHGKQVVDALAKFFAQDATQQLAMDAMKFSILERLANKLNPNT